VVHDQSKLNKNSQKGKQTLRTSYETENSRILRRSEVTPLLCIF